MYCSIQISFPVIKLELKQIPRNWTRTRTITKSNIQEVTVTITGTQSALSF